MQKALEMVWDFRRKYHKWWPTPGALDSLRFSYTEAAEALDAHLRTSRPDYARNNHREQNVHEELADCAIMLLSALLPSYTFGPSNVTYTRPAFEYVDEAAAMVGSALGSYKYWRRLEQKHGHANPHIWQEKVLIALGFIEHYPGMDLLPMIEQRLERIRRKHVPEEAS